MKRRTVLSALAALGSLGLPLGAPANTEISGVQVADQLSLGGQTLLLNGVGIRKRYGFSVYVCGLYLQQRCTTVSEIFALPGAKRIVVVLLRDLSTEDFGDAFLAGIRHNSTPDQTRMIGVQLVQLGQLSVNIPRLKPGDVVTYDYEPSIGSGLAFNGRPGIEPAPGAALFEAFLRIWIGDHPADDILKDRLLGKKAPESTFNTGFRSGG